MVWHTAHRTQIVTQLFRYVTLCKTPPCQNEASDVLLKWNAFEVSAFLTQLVMHNVQLQSKEYANHLHLLTKGILDAYSGYDFLS